MAGFKTHITTSTVLGIGYGAVGYLALDMPIQSSLIAAGLCSVSGMLPDIDSDTGRPLKEAIAFSSAVVPMLLLHRFMRMGLDHETIVLIGAGIYVVIRFGLARLIRRCTVHRGMWHSLPACAIAGLLAYLLCTGHSEAARVFKACGVVLGFMSHLVLDEIWSIEWRGAHVRLKKSFGTAIKLWGKSSWANFAAYANLAVIGLILLGDPYVSANLQQLEPRQKIGSEQPAEGKQQKEPLKTAGDWLRGVVDQGQKLWR